MEAHGKTLHKLRFEMLWLKPREVVTLYRSTDGTSVIQVRILSHERRCPQIEFQQFFCKGPVESRFRNLRNINQMLKRVVLGVEL